MARKDAGLTQAKVAEALKCGQAKINKIEGTLVSVSLIELDLMIELYRVSPEQAEELRRLAADDQRNGPPRTKLMAWSAFADLSDLEPDAERILCWHSERIPGPLQSERYMLKQFERFAESTVDVVRLLGQRKERARIFTMASGPYYGAILSESSLHRMPGGRSFELVVDQVEHLLRLLHQHERLDLRILPFTANISFVDSDFAILRFASKEDDFAYIEFPGGARKFTRREELASFQEHWEALERAALSRADTMDYLHVLT